jgi:hypothetical protein
MKRCGNAIYLLVLLAMAAGTAFGQSARPRHANGSTQQPQGEQILNYHSDIEVRDDGSMLVTESIRVNVLGYSIRHGIYRDFPTTYTDPWGRRYVVGFELFGATRDAQPEQTQLEDLSNGKRIRLGNANALVPHGEHIYTITYSTNRQIGFFQDHDELFWNVTGNGWIFPIDRASATVEMPGKIPTDSVTLDGYTGPQGSTAKDLTFVSRADGSFAFQTTRVLGMREGLTILLRWPKGYMAPPTQQQLRAYFIQDNQDLLIGAAGFVLILIYYVIAWTLVGRDPKAGTIVVRYDPPAGLSPAAMRYLERMGYDNKVFTAAILDMAVKGYLTIREEGGTYTLKRGQADENVLSAEERMAAKVMFTLRDELWLHQENHSFVSGAMKALKLALKIAEDRTYFVRNTSYMILPVLLSVIVVAGVTVSRGGPAMAMAGFITLWLSIWTLAVAGMIKGAGQTWRAAVAGGPQRVALMGKAFSLSLFILPFLGGEVMGLWFFSKVSSRGVVLSFAGMVTLHIVFHHLLKAPTKTGRALMDQVEGFKMFLGKVEGDRLNRVNPPTQTPEAFEKFLPYALALGVEQAWAEKFSSVIGGASQTPGRTGGTYSPAWYSGADWNSMGASGFAGAMGGAFSSAISSSAAAPGSSGGGGGGSGGGGGGGGGGGW